MTVKQAFDEYSRNLELTDRQDNVVATARANVVAALKAGIKLHSDESRVIGSWARNTMTRYLKEGDVDVMVMLHYGANKSWDTGPGTITCLDRVRSLLDMAYPRTEKRRDRNCITMQFAEFRLDVVPAFVNNGGYYRIPDSIRKAWVETDPPGFAAMITEVNKAMDGTFVPLIKMVKGWNRDVGWPIRSFHLECLMHAHYASYTQSYTYSSTLARFFDRLPGYLATACYDPVRWSRVDDYLDNNATTTLRQMAINKAKRAAAASAEAYEDQTKYSTKPNIAISEWKALMGEFFPSFG
jgi:SMODS domain-containing protein